MSIQRVEVITGRGGERAAAIDMLSATAKFSDIDPDAGLAAALRRIKDYPASRLDGLLPWNRRRPTSVDRAA
jgi:hypothetical protein